MKKTIKSTLAGLLVVPALLLGFGAFGPLATTAGAQCDTSNLGITSGKECAKGDEQPADLFGTGGIFTTIVNILLFLIGAVAVIMLIIGGIRYTLSGGDQNAVTSAKNTILYSIVGIIVAILAYAIVNFVITSFVD